MALQLLQHTKRSGDKIYRYYSIAESYREQGRSKKRVLAHLGALSLEQAEKLRTALRLKNDPTWELLQPQRIACSGTWDYLDLSVFHQLWMHSGIANVIDPKSGDVELGKLLEIFVLNRITSPTSKLGITRWYPSTALSEILGVPAASISESRMYRALAPIEEHHVKIERHIFKTLIQPHARQSSDIAPLYFYDLSSSYFEGDEVSIAAFNEHSKDHRPDRLQVVLGLLIDPRGIPFSWDVMPGNQGDAPTLIKQIGKFKNRFRVERALLVFDRGFLSHDNLEAVEKAGYDYLTGLRSPQIQAILPDDFRQWIQTITLKTAADSIAGHPGWVQNSETSYHRSLGIINERQTVLLFDVDRFRAAVLKRQEKIEAFRQWVHKHNEWLANFKKDAFKDAIEKDVKTELKKRGLEEFVEFSLHEYRTENLTFKRRPNNPFPSQGYHRKVRSFQVVITGEKSQSPLDGVFALITSRGSKLTPEQMIVAYREKYSIESAFREMKSVLKLRPWFVYKEQHVRAHYTVCVLSYLLERWLDSLLETQGCKAQGWTLPRLKEELKKYRLAEIQTGSSRTPARKVLQNVPVEIQTLLRQLALKTTLSPNG